MAPDRAIRAPPHLLHSDVKLSRRGCAFLPTTIQALEIDANEDVHIALPRILKGAENSAGDSFKAICQDDLDVIWRLYVSVVQRAGSELYVPRVFLCERVSQMALNSALPESRFVFADQIDFTYLQKEEFPAFDISTMFTMVGDYLASGSQDLPKHMPSFFKNLLWLCRNQHCGVLVPASRTEQIYIESLYARWDLGSSKPNLHLATDPKLLGEPETEEHVIKSLNRAFEGHVIDFTKRDTFLMNVNHEEARKLAIYLASNGYMIQAMEVVRGLERSANFQITNLSGEPEAWKNVPFAKALAWANARLYNYEPLRLYRFESRLPLDEQLQYQNQQLKDDLVSLKEKLDHMEKRLTRALEISRDEVSELSKTLSLIEEAISIQPNPLPAHKEQGECEAVSATVNHGQGHAVISVLPVPLPRAGTCAAIYTPKAYNLHTSKWAAKYSTPQQPVLQSKFAPNAQTRASANQFTPGSIDRKAILQSSPPYRHGDDKRVVPFKIGRVISKWESKTIPKGAKKSGGGRDSEYVLVGKNRSTCSAAATGLRGHAVQSVKSNTGLGDSIQHYSDDFDI